MNVKVAKFGGTSLADSANIKISSNVIKSNPERKIVVVSAPGAIRGKEEKITDLLYKCLDECRSGNCYEQTLNKITSRFNSIIKELNLNLCFECDYKKLKEKIESDDIDYVVSRGEYFNAKIVAENLNFKFVDAADVIFFDSNGKFNLNKSRRLISNHLKTITGGVVIPGFYGATKDKRIKTFSRGGSDFTGAIVASAVCADIYENWTDVNSFFACNPDIVKNPLEIRELTYKELRDLSFMGATVLHPDSIFPVYKQKIPINIRNTFNMDAEGTMIIAHCFQDCHEIAGITGKRNLVKLTIEKEKLNDETNHINSIFLILKRRKALLENILMSVDSISIFLSSKADIETISSEIENTLKGCTVRIEKNIALSAIVGEKIAKNSRIINRVFTVLSENNLPIKMIDFGSSETNIIIGIDNFDFNKMVHVLYQEFFEN